MMNFEGISFIVSTIRRYNMKVWFSKKCLRCISYILYFSWTM